MKKKTKWALVSMERVSDYKNKMDKFVANNPYWNVVNHTVKCCNCIIFMLIEWMNVN